MVRQKEPRPRSLYVCGECGGRFPKWAGQCSDCGAWNSLQEELAPSPEGGGKGRFGGFAGAGQGGRIQTLGEIEPEATARWSTGVGELDRVLGGGLVQGSVVLLGGDPGIGKSTLLLQCLCQLSRHSPSLYVTGEESPHQVSLRSRRLGLEAAQVRLLPETSVERILAAATAERPRVMVIDSVQTLYTELLQSAPGSVSQVRECSAQLVRFAKLTDTSVFLVGHVTKEGALAGPRVLEHMVDTVLYFEGESGSQIRLVRAVKNRFGAVNELGVFAMTDQGLREVRNPSALFLSRRREPVAGSVVMVTREGTRPLLVEVQALVDQSPLANPRRITLGLEQNRLAMLLGVVHRHGGVFMYDQDVYINAVGGVRITETAADMAVLLAVLSSHRDHPLPSDLAVFGEIGLSGEVRPVTNGADRLREAARQGFRQVCVSADNARKQAVAGLEILPVENVRQLIERFGLSG